MSLSSKLFLILTAALSTTAYAVDGVTLINQATVMGSGGFPYVISQPGSYRLSGNLVSTTTAIQIIAPSVVLDMNGFSISCSSCSGVPGILSSASFTSVVNGAVSGFGGSTNQNSAGIYFGANGGSIDRMKLYNNSWGALARSSLSVTNTFATNNIAGIECDGNLTISGSQISNNASIGIVANNATITTNVIDTNGTSASIPVGLEGGGIQVTGGTIIGNVLTNNGNGAVNTGYAIFAVGASSITMGQNTFLGNRVDISGSVLSQGNSSCGGGSC